MIHGLKLAGAAVAITAALVPSAAAGGDPAAALGVSPLRLELKGASSAAITVRNPGARPLVVTVTRAGFARTLHGKPRIEAAGGASGWLRARPSRLRLAPHATGVLRLTAKPPRTAKPGDHPALVLLATRPPAAKTFHVLLRVGVIVLVRVAGTVIHRFVPQALSVRRDRTARILSLRLANRGNVAERIAGARVALELLRDGKAFAKLRPRRFDLLPHSAGIAEFLYRGPASGRVLARVVFQPKALGPERLFGVTLP